MKIYLDDEREAPPGWRRAHWPDEVIELLKTERVEALSLDHDLGDDERGTGYDVLSWLEEAVVSQNFKAPKLHVHSANPPARRRMQAAIDAIKRHQSKPRND